MKLIALLSVLFTSPIAFASGTGEPILTKYQSNGPMAPKYRESKTVEVYPMGDVLVSVNHKGKMKESKKGPLSPELMIKIKNCKTQIAKHKSAKRPNCAGGSSTSYYMGEKLIYIRTCGEESKNEASCVTAMMDLLDRF